jgi:hypothetical protein
MNTATSLRVGSQYKSSKRKAVMLDLLLFVKLMNNDSYRLTDSTCGSSRYSTCCGWVELGSAVHILRVPPANSPSVRCRLRWTSRPNAFSLRRCNESFVGGGVSVSEGSLPPSPPPTVRTSRFDKECTWTTSYSGTKNANSSYMCVPQVHIWL